MARVTVEDCLKYVPNRFDLVTLAAKRTRQLIAGADSELPVNNDKMTVLALREIGEGLIDLEALAKDKPNERIEEDEHDLDAEAMALMQEETQLPGINVANVNSGAANDLPTEEVTEKATEEVSDGAEE